MSIERQRFNTAAPHTGTAAESARDDGVTDRPPRRTTVIFGIIAALVLFALAVGVLGYRAWKRGAPTQLATVVGNDQWNGVELEISGAALPESYRTVIDRTGRYSVPFFLPPGRYTLIARMGGSEVYRSEFELAPRETQYITLPPKVPATKPSTRAE